MAETFLVGGDAVGSYPSGMSGEYLVMCKFTCAVSGDITEVRIKLQASANIKVGVYADSVGSPAALLASNQTGVACGIVGWNSIPLELAVTTPTVYWLALNVDTNAKALYNGAGGTTKYKALAYGNAFPEPAGGEFTDQNWLVAIAGWEVIVAVGGSPMLFGGGVTLG